MVNVKIKPKEGDEVVIYGAQDITIDFTRGSVRVNFSDEGGPHTGEYALDQLNDVDWDVVPGTALAERNLTTYQQRAIQNLPPVQPGAPDLTYEPKLPKIVKPTEAKLPESGPVDEAIADARVKQTHTRVA